MRDYISIGPSPYDEPCAQVGQPDYRKKALTECHRFIELLHKTFGPEPKGAELAIKSFPHDFGTYYEVVCWFDPELRPSVEYALRCEAETPAMWEAESLSGSSPELLYLWHPGTKNIFSGYGLSLANAHLVGLVMVDCPRPADPAWLAELRSTFGAYQLTAMVQGGERGLVCQMHIAPESLRYLKRFDHPLTTEVQKALLPLRNNPPAVTLTLRWERTRSCWVSTIGGDEVCIHKKRGVRREPAKRS